MKGSMARRSLLNSHGLFKDSLRSWRMGVGASTAAMGGPAWMQAFHPNPPSRSMSWWLGMRGSWSMRLRHDGIIVSLERPRPPVQEGRRGGQGRHIS